VHLGKKKIVKPAGKRAKMKTTRFSFIQEGKEQGGNEEKGKARWLLVGQVRK